MIPIPRVGERDRQRPRRIPRMKLGAVKRKYDITFEECRGIIRLFISGISIENMVSLTGLRKSKIVEVLSVTKELLLREGEIGMLAPR